MTAVCKCLSIATPTATKIVRVKATGASASCFRLHQLDSPPSHLHQNSRPHQVSRYYTSYGRQQYDQSCLCVPVSLAILLLQTSRTAKTVNFAAAAPLQTATVLEVVPSYSCPPTMPAIYQVR